MYIIIKNDKMRWCKDSKAVLKINIVPTVHESHKLLTAGWISTFKPVLESLQHFKVILLYHFL